MIVVDASAAVEQLRRSPQGMRVDREFTERGPALVPAHFEAECVAALARLRRRGALSAASFAAALPVLAEYPATRVPLATLLGAATLAWLGPLSAYDAFYATLAEVHDVALVTCDARLAEAVGARAVYIAPGEL